MNNTQTKVGHLSPFEKWMAKSNLQYIDADGLETVVTRLRSQGYNRVADEVERLAKAKGEA